MPPHPTDLLHLGQPPPDKRRDACRLLLLLLLLASALQRSRIHCRRVGPLPGVRVHVVRGDPGGGTAFCLERLWRLGDMGEVPLLQLEGHTCIITMREEEG